jgi:hypothetical protein
MAVVVVLFVAEYRAVAVVVTLAAGVVLKAEGWHWQRQSGDFVVQVESQERGALQRPPH